MKNLRKVYIIILIVMLTICLLTTLSKAVENEPEESKFVKLYTLPSVSNMSLVGTNRGNNHDKQHLGIYMKAGSSFEIRQTNLNLGKDLVVEVLNNDSQTEKAITIPKNGNWVTVSADVDSVPFIRTLFDVSETPEVEIKNLTETEELTYFKYKDDEAEFFEKWRENNHSYAVIECERATFLVPIKDRELIVRPNDGSYYFKSIDEMLEYYLDFVEQFDRFLGLEYNSQNPLNNNVKTKFFVKANKRGGGAAYYGGTNTAQSSDTMSAYLGRGWLSLHEFGHGYEGSLANRGLGLVDVMNNILSHYYQITFLKEGDGGWLGNRLSIEGKMKEARESKELFTEFSYQEKLYMFVNILDKIGPEQAMAYVHTKYREYENVGIHYNASDMYAKSFSEFSNYNVVPYLTSQKVFPTVDMQAEIYEQEMPMLYYLRDLVESDERAESLRTDMNLEGKYSLVSNADIAKYNMKGNLILDIEIDNLEELRGKKIYIKDGKNVIKELVVDGAEIVVNDLPVGIYELKLPNSKEQAYNYDYTYVVVTENTTNTKKVVYERLTKSALTEDTKISFRGLGDGEFATITYDLKNKKLNIKVNGGQPHVYFSDEYVNIQVIDNSGNTIFERSLLGTKSEALKESLNMEIGYVLRLKHREGNSRLVFFSELLNEKEDYIAGSNEVTDYVITEYGIQKLGSSADEQYENYKNKLEKYANKVASLIPEEMQKNKYNYFSHKNSLLSSILELKEEDRIAYLEKYRTLINGSSPTISDVSMQEFEVGEELVINLEGIKYTDLEDGEIDLTVQNTELEHTVPMENGKIASAGTYSAKLIVKDLDGNKAEKEFTVLVKEAKTPDEDVPSNPEQNNPSTSNPSENDPSASAPEQNTPSTNNPSENSPEQNTPSTNNQNTNSSEQNNSNNSGANKTQQSSSNSNKTDKNSNKSNTVNVDNNSKNKNTVSSTAPWGIPKAGELSIIATLLVIFASISAWSYIQYKKIK